MATKNKLTLFILWISLFSASALAGGVPEQMNFQGFLADSLGSPITATQPMRFGIYKDATRIWYGEYSSVNVQNGYFSVLLGNAGQGGSALDPVLGTPGGSLPILASSLNGASSATALSVEIEIYNGAAWEAITPKFDLATALFALRADTVDGYHSADLVKLDGSGRILSQDTTPVISSTGEWIGPAINASGAVAVGNGLTVSSGGATIAGASSVAGDLSLTGTGNLNTAGNVTATGSLSAASASTTGNVSVGGTLTSSGLVTASNGLTVSTGGASVTGDSSITGNLSLTGNASVGGTLAVTGAVSTSSTISAGGNITGPAAAAWTVQSASNQNLTLQSQGTGTTTIGAGSGGVKIGANGTALTTGIVKGSKTGLNYTAAFATTVTVTGAAAGDAVFCTLGTTAATSGNYWRYYATATAADTVTVSASPSGSPPSVTSIVCVLFK